MLRIEYEMLTFIHQHPGCSWSDVLNAFDPASQCRVTDAVLSAFLSQGLISAVPPSEKPPVCRVRLSPSAVQLILLYEEEQRRQKKENERLAQQLREQRELEERRIREQRELEERRIREQHRWERKSQFLTALLGLFGTVVGALLSFFLTFFAQRL